MKKYLLLATVAGCLLGANAMAEDSATVTAKVNIKYGCTLESPNDMDFGEIILSPENSSDIVFTMAEDGNITHDGSSYVLKYLQNQSSGAASVTINCGPEGESDAEGEADLAFNYENAGALGNDLEISDASMVEVLGEGDEGSPETIDAGSSTHIKFAGSKTYKIPAKLTVKAGVAPGEYENQVLRVTLSY